MYIPVDEEKSTRAAWNRTGCSRDWQNAIPSQVQTWATTLSALPTIVIMSRGRDLWHKLTLLPKIAQIFEREFSDGSDSFDLIEKQQSLRLQIWSYRLGRYWSCNVWALWKCAVVWILLGFADFLRQLHAHAQPTYKAAKKSVSKRLWILVIISKTLPFTVMSTAAFNSSIFSEMLFIKSGTQKSISK